MTNLILSSNFNGNKLQGVGSATLQDDTIYIRAEPNTTVTLLRDINKVTLLVANGQEQIANGKAKLEDVYTLENNDQKLIIKVETENIKHETNLFTSSEANLFTSSEANLFTSSEANLFINPDPIVDATSTKRKTTLTVGFLTLILLIVSVVFGVQQKRTREFNTKSEERLSVAISNYENKTRESFVSAKEIAIKLKEDGYKNEKLDELLKNISENESEILGEIKPDVKDLLDLTLQINGFNGNKLASTGEVMFVFDEQEKNIIRLDLNGKDAKIVAKKDVLDGVINIASYGDRLFTLNSDGIYEIEGKREKVKDNEWSNPLFYLYSSNIYLVDRNNNQILRYSSNNNGFGDKTDWLAPGIEADFSKVIDMTIDGSIWLLSSSGKVTKFTNGNPVNIQMAGIVTPLENPTAIYTNEENKYVYILDKNIGRVVALEKNGKFKVQYISDQIKNATDLVVSEKEEKVVLLTGSKLMYFEPK